MCPREKGQVHSHACFGDFNKLLLQVSSIRVLPRRRSTVLVLLCRQPFTRKQRPLGYKRYPETPRFDRYEHCKPEKSLIIDPPAHAHGKNLTAVKLREADDTPFPCVLLKNRFFQRYKVHNSPRSLSLQSLCYQADDNKTELCCSVQPKVRSRSSDRSSRSQFGVHSHKRMRRLLRRLRKQLSYFDARNIMDIQQAEVMPSLTEEAVACLEKSVACLEESQDDEDYISRMKADVFISHEENDLQIAMTFLERLEEEGFSCILGERNFLPGTPRSDAVLEAVMSSKRVVMLLSRSFLKTGWCNYELQMSLCEMFESKRVLLVPVLLNVTETELPLCLRNLSCVDVRGDPNYMRKLISFLKGPEVSVRDIMPAGDLAHGLSWNYFFYLQFVLPTIAERVEKFHRNNPHSKDPRMPRKLYILVPASCFCPPSLESADIEKRIQYGGHLEDVRKTTAGSVDRIYKHTVWNIRKKDGEIIQFVGEYSNVIHTFYELENQRIAGLDSRNRLLQRQLFLTKLQNTITMFGIQEQAQIVNFKDTDDDGRPVSLSSILEPVVERDRLPAPMTGQSISP